jgi:hypothetical protein
MAHTQKTNGSAVSFPQITEIVAPTKQERPIVISPPKFEVAVIGIKGTAPYVQHRFSQKSLMKMEATQAAGQRAKKGTKREPRDPNADYLASMYESMDGWHGIPASAFRNGLISACRMCGFAMTRAKLSLFVLADGLDKTDGTPLVRITGTPIMHTATARNDNGGTDIRYRAMWTEWSAGPRLQWDVEQFSASDVFNLLMRMGIQVGVGEGRPDSKNSAGMGWGTFEVIA